MSTAMETCLLVFSEWFLFPPGATHISPRPKDPTLQFQKRTKLSHPVPWALVAPESSHHNAGLNSSDIIKIKCAIDSGMFKDPPMKYISKLAYVG